MKILILAEQDIATRRKVVKRAGNARQDSVNSLCNGRIAAGHLPGRHAVVSALVIRGNWLAMLS